jgi:hypothetical protein
MEFSNPKQQIKDVKETMITLTQNLSNLSLKLDEADKEKMNSKFNVTVTVAKFQKKIKALEKKVKTLQSKTTKLNKQLKEKDKTIKSLEEQLTEKDSNLKSLESLLENLQKDTDSVLVPKVDEVLENFKNKYNVDNMPNIDNLKVIASYRYSDNPRDEYSAFHSGELELSYDYVKGNNHVISVKYKADYNSSQTYDNRYEPYVEFESSLEVSPNLHYTYHRDEEIIYEDKLALDEDKWCDLMNKVLDDILCEANNFSHIVRSITEEGEYSSEN